MSSNLRKGESIISSEISGSALDAAVRGAFSLSWGQAREFIGRGKVTVDGVTVTDPRVRVRAGARLTFDPAARRARAEVLPEAAIVHLDAHLAVVEKPSGVSTIPFDPEGMGKSIAVRARAGEATALDERVRIAIAHRERIRGPVTLGVVHRIDKETSGLLVFTRTWLAKKALLSAFRFHHVHRRYLALVHGHPTAGEIRSNFVVDRGDGLRGSVEHRGGRARAIGNEKVQLAVTHIEVIERFDGKAAGCPASLVSCRLETGRTHQIRIHLSESGHPVIGDRVYVRGYRGTVIPARRLMLHAAELGFVHPATEAEMKWTSPLPPDMGEVLRFLRR